MNELIRLLNQLDPNLEVVTNNNTEYSRIYAVEYDKQAGDIFAELVVEYFDYDDYTKNGIEYLC
ncbi:MAG: hypothetical protein NC218_08535 [Acetobacter sp.]|nr:hypothetical protein [Acetobacter sp.]